MAYLRITPGVSGLTVLMLSFFWLLPAWAEEDLYNPEAVVPPQCYTKHEGRFNPCYVCHQTHEAGQRLNAMRDQRLQSEYDFLPAALTNHWTNLFVDRRSLIAKISDEEMLAYINQENYTDLAPRLEAAGWRGYVPRIRDLHRAGDAFDARGFARDGSGWVAFNYKPLPSTFWPTNGSIDDVMIRLPEAFRQNVEGEYDGAFYVVNLSIAEAAIKDLEAISVPPTDERRLGLDLDGDGRLRDDVTTLQRPTHYVGAASQVAVHPFLYPQGTEFLHTVRYLGVDGGIHAPARLKELRYMRKHSFLSPDEVKARYVAAREEEPEDGAGEASGHDEGGRGKNAGGVKQAGDLGYDNGFGWYVQGFIEDAEGHLRPQTREEGLFCMGCHASIGSTIDHSFAFARKITGAAGWGYIDLEGMRDAPLVGEDLPEILQYFQRVGGGDEFRENGELMERYFVKEGVVREDKVRESDVEVLITPSRERALALNKAYYTIVREQSFIRGRDANLAPMENVFREVDPQTAPTLPPEKQFRSDIRLDWSF